MITETERTRLFQSFRTQDERTEFAKILDNAVRCHKQHVQRFSGFFDPCKARKFAHAVLSVKNLNVCCAAFGGYDHCERQIIGVSPKTQPLEQTDFPIAVIQAAYNSKFSRTLTHRDFLGSLMGLGIERHYIGDIALSDSAALIVVHGKMAGYIFANLEKAGRTTIKTTLLSTDKVAFPASKKEARRLSVASLRLDGVIAAAMCLSRKAAANLIAAEKVFINWVPCTQAAKEVSAGDFVTVRQYGRMEIGAITGNTKKGRIVLEVFVSV